MVSEPNYAYYMLPTTYYMRVVFFGTPDYVLPILKALKKHHEIVAVVTQPPKKVGRKKLKTFSAIDNYAHKKNIPVFYNFEKLPSADIGILASYGKIIPEKILQMFPLGILNIHPSLLPKFRGASPIQANIINDPENVGVTIIKLTKEMDKGPIVTSFKDELLPTDTTETLRARLFDRSKEVLLELLPIYSKMKIQPKPQDEASATYTKILTKQDGFVDIKRDDPEIIVRKLKAYTPWPGIHTNVQLTIKNVQVEKRLKIIKCHLENQKLVLDEVQLEGKNPVSWKQFSSAYPSLSF